MLYCNKCKIIINVKHLSMLNVIFVTLVCILVVLIIVTIVNSGSFCDSCYNSSLPFNNCDEFIEVLRDTNPSYVNHNTQLYIKTIQIFLMKHAVILILIHSTSLLIIPSPFFMSTAVASTKTLIQLLTFFFS